MIKLSAIIIVYHEEDNIKFCLDSLKNIVDEIIIVHDGSCHDKTLAIGQSYTKNIFIRPRIGMMEAHLVYALNKTSGDWILRIDADEFLSDDLKNNLKNLSRGQASAYTFNWRKYQKEGKKFVGPVLKKTVFLKKSDLYWVAIPHLAWQSRGKVCRVNYVLGHLEKGGDLLSSFKKQNNWAKIHARYVLKDFQDLDSFQANRADWEKFYSFSRKNKNLILLPLLKFTKTFFQKLLIDRVGLKETVKQSVYNFLFGYYIYLGRKKINLL